MSFAEQQPSYRGTPERRRSDLPAMLLRVLLPLIVAVPAVIHGVGLAALNLRAETVTGRVVSGQAGVKSKSIDVTFVTRAGQSVTADLTAYGSYAKGDLIDLVYDREKPTRLKNAAKPFWLDAVFIFGPLLFVVLWGIDVVRRWRRPTPGPVDPSL